MIPKSLGSMASYPICAAAMVALVIVAGCGTTAKSPTTGTSKKTPTPSTQASATQVQYSSLAFFGRKVGMVSQSMPSGSRVLTTLNGGFSWKGYTTGLRLSSLQIQNSRVAFALAATAGCPATLPLKGGNSNLSTSTLKQRCQTGIVDTIDGGGHWTWLLKLKWPQLVSQYGFKQGTTGWAILEQNSCPSPGSRCPSPSYSKTVTTTDGGQTWQNHLKTSGQVVAMSFANPAQGWAIASKGAGSCKLVMLSTKDRGLHWSKRPMQQCASGAVFLSFPSKKVGFLFSGSNCASKAAQGNCKPALFKTRDAGATWTRLGTPGATSSSSTITGFRFLNPEVGWMSISPVGSPGAVLTTTDGGRTWTSHLRGTPAAAGAVAFPTKTSGWVIKNVPHVGSRVFHSVNGGRRWHLVYIPYSGELVPGHPNALTVTYFPKSKGLTDLAHGPVRIVKYWKLQQYVRELNLSPPFTGSGGQCSLHGGFTFTLQFTYKHHKPETVLIKSPGCNIVYASHPNRPKYHAPPKLVSRQLPRDMKPGTAKR